MAGERAQAGELGALDMDQVIALRLRIGETASSACFGLLGIGSVRRRCYYTDPVIGAVYVLTPPHNWTTEFRAQCALSRSKLSGFKSFCDPTTFELPGQLVGVVGPNGCGKSNIIDATRWVLGESRAAELRGESMQDVIFSGSGDRKPAQRASVEMVFDNGLGRIGGAWSGYRRDLGASAS